MKIQISQVWCWEIFVAACLVLGTSVGVRGQSEKVVRVDELGIRKSASRIVMPTFPETARRRKAHGVAVVELQYNGTGDVTDIQVLESPDPTIKEALIDAVKQWKFRISTLNGKPLSVRGKLTFYYIVEKNGHARVENPRQFKS